MSNMLELRKTHCIIRLGMLVEFSKTIDNFDIPYTKIKVFWKPATTINVIGNEFLTQILDRVHEPKILEHVVV